MKRLKKENYGITKTEKTNDGTYSRGNRTKQPRNPDNPGDLETNKKMKKEQMTKDK